MCLQSAIFIWWGSASCKKQFKGVFQTFICIFQGIVNLMITVTGLQSKLLPVSRASSILFLHLYISWFINSFSQLLGTEKLGKWKLFNKQQADGGHGGGSVPWKDSTGSCLVTMLPFLWSYSVLKRTGYGIGKGMQFLDREVNHNLATELSFGDLVSVL